MAHATRHTAGTLLVRATDLKTAGAILGHSDGTMTLRYATLPKRIKGKQSKNSKSSWRGESGTR
jgi:integrase